MDNKGNNNLTTLCNFRKESNNESRVQFGLHLIKNKPLMQQFLNVAVRRVFRAIRCPLKEKIGID